MFDSKKLSQEIIETFNSLDKEEQNRILSNCGLSFQKKQRPSTNNTYRVQISTKPVQKPNTYKNTRPKKELVHC